VNKVISIRCTCDYLLKRAEKHRRAGRYDEAMALLWNAKTQFGIQDSIELEMARIYDEIGCDDEACRSYLRVVRLGGEHKAEALFHLALSGLQRGDVVRAYGYFEQFLLCKNRSVIAADLSEMLARQLAFEFEKPKIKGRKIRAKQLAMRAGQRLQEGRPFAAQRCIERSIRLRPSAQSYTMLACCHLVRENYEEAVHAASYGHTLRPRNVQALCVLADACAANGDDKKSANALRFAALYARSCDDLLAASIESAKHGWDDLTLMLTQRLLRIEPFHTRAMMLRACACMNLGKMQEACRILSRLCGLVPENSVCEYYFKLLRDGKLPQEKLSLGMDVTHDEGVRRASELIAKLYNNPEETAADSKTNMNICRLCDWAIRSQMVGSHTKTIALILLSALGTELAECVLLDALTDPVIADSFKFSVLQMLTNAQGFKPFYVDIHGSLTRLAAGGISGQPIRASQVNSRIVQRTADALAARYPKAPQMLLGYFLVYLQRYGQPAKRHEGACAAALEYMYLMRNGKQSNPTSISRKYHVSPRIMMLYARRFERSNPRLES